METEDTIELPYASFFRRLVAFILDYLLISFLMSIILSLFMPAGFAIEGPEVVEYDMDYVRDLTEAAGPLMLLFYIAWWLYNALMHASSWQATLGKRVMSIIVTDLEGNRISFAKATLRFIGKLISTFLIFLGYLLAAFTPRRQALHDMIGGTIVLKYRISEEVEDQRA